MRPAMDSGPDRGTRCNREPRARQVGELLSILFLGLLGTLATMTSLPTGGHAQADSSIASAALPSAGAR